MSGYINNIGILQPIGNVGIMDFLSNSIGPNYPVEPVYPIATICFPAKTFITTNQGDISIDKIDTTIHTIRNKKIVAITKTISRDTYLVLFQKDSLGENISNKDTIISKNHMIFYSGQMIPAKLFLNKFIKVTKIPYSGEPLYNVLLEEHDKMLVHNLICETLHPENLIAQLYKILPDFSEENQTNIISSLNESILYNKEVIITCPTLVN